MNSKIKFPRLSYLHLQEKSENDKADAEDL